MKLEIMPRFPITPGPWVPVRRHEDEKGPMFDIDPDERAEYDARPYTGIVNAAGQTVCTAHDIFQFHNATDAKAMAKVPELLQIAMWAEAALGFLSTTAKSPADRAEFERRFRDTSEVLNAIKA